MFSFGFDIKTLALVAGLSALFQALSLILLWRSVPRSQATPAWAIAGVCLAGGSVLLSQRDNLPEIMTVFLGNLVIISAHAFYMMGFVKHFRIKINHLLLIILPIFVFGILLYWSIFIYNDRKLRVLFICVCAFYFSMMHVYVLFRGNKNEPSAVNTIFAISWFVHGGFVLFRGIHTVTTDHEIDNFLNGYWIHELAFIDMILWCFAFAILLPALELQKAHKRMKAVNDEVIQANLMKSNFLAAMSHDMRTPLNPIIGFSNLIETKIHGDNALNRYIDYATHIRKAAEGLLELLNDLLDLEKIEAGRLVVEPKPVRIADVLNEHQALFTQVAEGRSQTIKTSVDGLATRELRVDRRMTKQMLTNLVSNALRYTPEGGVVDLAFRETRGGGVAIVVTDNGPGMPPELIAQIGEPFLSGPKQDSQDGAASGAHARSTGLGLALVKRMMAAHGGDLIVRRVSDQGGTEASLEFPESCVLRPGGGSTAVAAAAP